MANALAHKGQTLTVDVGNTIPRAMTQDSINSGMAFLNGELEKRDARLLEPLNSVTWPRDIVAKTGGGWVEYSSQYFVDYASTGGIQSGIIGGETNNIPIVQANLNKVPWQVFTFSNIMKVPFVDQQKLQGIGRSLDNILDKGLRLNYNKSIDYTIYDGIPQFNIPGLVNNPTITAATAPKGASGSSNWTSKTPDEILADINYVLTTTWENSGYDVTGMANHIGLPPLQFGYIATTLISSAGAQSILDYVLMHNIGRTQGVDLQIVPMNFWLTGAGVSGTDRMIAYVNDEDRVNFDLTVPLSRVMTQPDVREMAYLTSYAAQFSQVKFLYPQSAIYYDGI